MKVAEALEQVDKLLSKPERYTSGAFARDKDGNIVPPESDEASCWCVAGAVRKVLRVDQETMRMSTLYGKVLLLLSRAAGNQSVARLNDVSYESMRALLAKARKLA